MPRSLERECRLCFVKTGRCIRCRKPVGPGPLEGGVGFWDLAGNSETDPSTNPPVTPVNTAKVEKLISEGTERLENGLNHIYLRQAQASRSQTVILTAIALLLVVSVFLDIMLWGTVRDIRDTISETASEETVEPTQDEETVMPTMPIDESMPDEETVPVEETMPDEETVPEEALQTEINSDEIKITKQPSSVPLSGTKTGREELFTIEAMGNNLCFEWQKMGMNGEWVTIDDSDRFLKVESSSVEGGGKSTLYQRTFDDSLFGKYRCIVRDSGAGSEKESSEVEVKRSENQGGDIPW